MSDLTDRLRSMHHDLRQGAMFTPDEDPAWDCTAEAADALEAAEAKLEAIDALARQWEQYQLPNAERLVIQLLRILHPAEEE